MHSMYYFQTISFAGIGGVCHATVLLFTYHSFYQAHVHSQTHIKLKGKQQPTRRKIRERAFTSFAD